MLSAVIITYNEEKNIEKCLSALKGVADEIIVLDSFSTDATEAICKRFDVIFVQHPFDGHIEQKNRAISYTKYDYVLSLDADEVLSEELKQSILQAKLNFDTDGYFFNRINNYCGCWIKHCGWYPDRKLRLWNKNKGAWGGTNPHDVFIMQPGTTQKMLKGDLLHYSYHSISDHLDQINKFTKIAAYQRFKKSKKISVFEILIHPLITFFKKYFLKKGFLDGYYGFIISVLSAYGSFLKDIQLRQLLENKKISNNE